MRNSPSGPSIVRFGLVLTRFSLPSILSSVRRIRLLGWNSSSPTLVRTPGPLIVALPKTAMPGEKFRIAPPVATSKVAGPFAKITVPAGPVPVIVPPIVVTEPLWKNTWPPPVVSISAPVRLAVPLNCSVLPADLIVPPTTCTGTGTGTDAA